MRKVSEDPDLKGRHNIHIVQADVTDYNALQVGSQLGLGPDPMSELSSGAEAVRQAAAAETAKITSGSLDYLIANAGLVTSFDAYDPIGTLGDQPEMLTKTLRELFEVNVIGNIHLFNSFLPLILKGQAKKVITISSGLADMVFTNRYDLTSGPLYSTSKAAMNMVVAKYSAQYKKDGVLFLALSPGLVEVGHFKDGKAQ